MDHWQTVGVSSRVLDQKQQNIINVNIKIIDSKFKVKVTKAKCACVCVCVCVCPVRGWSVFDWKASMFCIVSTCRISFVRRKHTARLCALFCDSSVGLPAGDRAANVESCRERSSHGDGVQCYRYTWAEYHLAQRLHTCRHHRPTPAPPAYRLVLRKTNVCTCIIILLNIWVVDTRTHLFANKADG